MATKYGTSGNDIIYGTPFDDFLYGYGGNDTLNGGTGNDKMYGGIGNDTYVVDSVGDVVYEGPGAGTDRVNAYVSDTLDANVENLYLYGTAKNGTGNVLKNTIVGNAYANTLSGLGGNDFLYGYGGNDTLNGGTGNDYMAGGIGNDTYIIDNAADSVYEGPGAGTDRVNAYVSDTLDANVENLYLYGMAKNGTGNVLKNTIVGNAYANTLSGLGGNDFLYGYGGNDTLNGGTGNDYMAGGIGNDTYIIDSAADSVYEGAGAGTDRVNAYVSDTLDANVENLYLYGTATNGTGNALDNYIYGNDWLGGGDGNNYLYGKDGNDHLYGGRTEFASSQEVYLYGGAGNDWLYGGKGWSYNLYGEDGNDYLYSSDGHHTILDGGKGSDTLYSGDYISTLYGGDGNDILKGENHASTLYGEDGDDYLESFSGATSYLDGGAGNDYLYNGVGAQYSTLVGGDGNDILRADGDRGWDDQQLYGGSGNDSFFFARGGSWTHDPGNIHDFSHTDDTIVLGDSYYDGILDGSIPGLSFTSGVLTADKYFKVMGYTDSNGLAPGIYNDTKTGNIWLNTTNAATSGDSWCICTVGGATATSLDNTDFVYFP